MTREMLWEIILIVAILVIAGFIIWLLVGRGGAIVEAPRGVAEGII